MNLKEFIRESLVSILDGINDAQHDLSRKGVGAAVNPKFLDAPSIGEADVQNIEFDIAVSVSEKSEKSAEGELKVVGILSADGKFTAGSEIGSVSRIRFALKFLPSFTTVPRKLNPIQTRAATKD